MSPSQGDVLKKIPDESNTPSAIELITPNTSNNPKVVLQNESSDWLTHGCARIYLVAFPYICAFNLLICISMSVFLPCPITLTVESIRHPLHQYIYVSSSNRPFKFPGWCIQIYKAISFMFNCHFWTPSSLFFQYTCILYRLCGMYLLEILFLIVWYLMSKKKILDLTFEWYSLKMNKRTLCFPFSLTKVVHISNLK